MLENGLLYFFPFLMIYAAASDLFTMTISNKVSVLLMAGFMTFAIWMGMDLQTILWHWAAFATVLLAGFTLFAFGIVGGGDAKLAASTALWFGWGYLLDYIFVASMIGAVLTLIFVFGRTHPLPDRLQRIGWFARLYNSENGVPYGIALGASALIIYPTTPWLEPIFKLS